MIKPVSRIARAGCGAAALLGPVGLAAGQYSDGPDVVYSEINSTWNAGAVGGVRAYALSSNTCNIGNQNLGWGGTVAGSPTLAMNAYRLHNGFLKQIGMSWNKTACCAAAGGGCPVSCLGGGGSVLGAGCLDVYSASYNGGQSRLQPRSSVNAWTGQMTNAPGGGGDAIFKRLQIRESDLNLTNFPGALYFVEGVYVAVDEVHPRNAMNNASYKRVTPSQTNYDLSVVSGSLGLYKPAIWAWRDHGLGANQPDHSVRIVDATVSGEGTFYVASKVTPLPNERWRYEYAIYNLNSHRSAASFNIPLPSGVNVTDQGFHDAEYHSGEVYDNTNWNMAAAGGSISWNTPATFAQNANTSALRWGMMNSFWFTADAAPGVGAASIGLFRPGTPESITVQIDIPTVPPCEPDIVDDNVLMVNDIFGFIEGWFNGNPQMDWNGNHSLDVADHFAFITDWFVGCP